MKMNKLKKIILISVISTATIFFSASYMMGKIVYNNSLGSSQAIANEDMIDVYSSRDGNPIEKLNNYEHEKIMIESPDNGYEIDTLVINAIEKTDDTIILVHGITSNYYELLKYAFAYLDKGYNVALYNQRNTGLTGGDTYTFGFYERFDLDNVIKHIKTLFPSGKLGVQGFSMGAATSAMHSKLNEEHKLVDFYILDSPYSEMKDSIMLGVELANVPLIPKEYIAFCGNIYTNMKEGFSYKDVVPANEVISSSTPTLLIHGTNDTICDPYSSEEIFKNIPHDNKELWMVDGAQHIHSFDRNPTEYINKVMSFIDKHTN